ncbi:MAG: calx-beta domain protein, partial [Cylindrospermopsis raciborskii KL1]|nr:calx-beta domain protein [Cylindrospermopsis raciborskii KL1]
MTGGVTQIFSTGSAFAALKSDGSVVTWGDSGSGGNSSSVASQLTSGVVSFADPFNDDRLVPLTGSSVTLAVSPTTVTEDGTSNLIYTFTRTGVTSNALTVNYTVGGTATNGTDYGNIGTSVTFAANSSTATVTVDPTADTTVESDETVSLTLASGTSYTIGTTSAVTGTITNDDTNVTLAVSPSSVTEDGSSNLIYTFTRTEVTSNQLTVNYTVGGTATNGTDYSNIGTSVTFAANSSTATVTVDPTADTTVEADETVSLTLDSGTGYTIGTTSAVTGTITNDDVLPVVTLVVNPSSVTEDGSSSLVYTFARTGATSNRLTVTCNVGGIADASDYRHYETANSYIRFTTIPIVIDVATNERTSQKLNGPGELSIKSGSATAKLDEFGNLYVKGDSSYGGNGSSDYSLVLRDVIEVHAVSEGTFIGLTVTGQLRSFGNWSGGGKTLENIVKIATSASGFVALDSEGKVYSYGAYTNGGVGSSLGSPPPSSVKIESIYAGGYGGYGAIDVEGNFWIWGYGSHGLTDAKAEKAIGIGFEYGKIHVLFEDGSVKAPKYGSGFPSTPFLEDGGPLSIFAIANATVTFGTGSSTASLTLDPTTDTDFEEDETITFTLISSDDYLIGTTTPVIGTITNDDTSVTLAVSPSSVTEDGSSNLIYTFTRTGVLSNALTVNYTVGGNATNGTDYGNIGTNVTFTANSATATVTVDPTADTTVESDETVSLTLASGTGYTIGTTSAVTGTITNDDLGDTQQITSTSTKL